MTPRSTSDPDDRRIRRSWWLLGGSLLLLSLVTVVRLAAGGLGLLDWLLALLVVLSAGAAAACRGAVQRLEVGRRAEAESFARILSGLSRSVSPEAIVEAIVADLAVGARADHIVVVRRRVDARVLDATLVTRRPGVASSTTIFPITDLEDAVDAPPADRSPVAIPIEGRGAARSRAEKDAGAARAVASTRPVRPARGEVAGAHPTSPAGRVAERIATRVRNVYGLSHTLAAPLRTDAGLVGAIVLSRRTAEPWSPAAKRILAGAAVEASAALARIYSHRAAEAMATTDPLTGLPNRRYFDEFCRLLARRRRSNDAVGILMIDIDRFKAVNDDHGHGVGDEVLRAVAGAIAGAVREEDVPARFGGEEFVVLLRNPSPRLATEVGERVREAVARLDLRDLGIGGVSVSVGVAVAVSPDQPIGDLVEEADRALYEAKRAGRDRVVVAA